MESRFELNFSGVKTPALTSCCFTPASGGEAKHSIQGKDFGWGKTANAVVAMALCAVAYKAWQASGQPETTFQFVGETGSASHTLRGSLLKDHLPAWFRKVFGERKVGTRHRSHGSKVFQPVRPPKSPNRKKGKHLSAVTVDSENYPADTIRVLRDGKEVSSVAKLVELAQQIEKQGEWKTKINYPELALLKNRKRAPAPSNEEFVFKAALGAENPKAFVLRTNEENLAGTDFRRLYLGGERLKVVRCNIETESPYFRFGFKLLKENGRLFGDDSITTSDENRIVHIGRNNWDRLNIGVLANDIFITTRLNGRRLKLNDEKMFSTGCRLSASVELRIDSDYVMTFSVNRIRYVNRPISPEICRRIVIAAWGDGEEYEVKVSDLSVNPESGS